jgi:hypothetical protein
MLIRLGGPKWNPSACSAENHPPSISSFFLTRIVSRAHDDTQDPSDLQAGSG